MTVSLLDSFTTWQWI